MRVLAPVSGRPFPDVPDSADRLEVYSRNDVSHALLLNEIGEWKVAGVRIVDVPSHHEGEGSDLCRIENVGVGRCLGSALENALMDRAQLVHVVALVRARTGIHE